MLILQILLHCIRAYLMKVILSSNFSEQHSDIPKILVKAGADLIIQSKVLEVILQASPLGFPLAVVDSSGITPFWAALEAAKFSAAQLLLRSGANINESTPDADASCLRLVVKNGLTSTVDRLCKLGEQFHLSDPETGLPPIWTALSNDDYASVFVANECDMGGNSVNSDRNCIESSLLRVVDANDQNAAVFLIKNGCQKNCFIVEAFC
uniref:Uncharacterized protein n=1 Tax=Panagrolaimus davidi TaxID=227884 RepID=A0A914Q1L1_9BILA